MFSSLKNFLYKLPKLVWSALQFVRSVISKIFGDPSISVKIHGRKLYMPLSHNLPIYVSRFKFYDTALTRISKFLRLKKKNLVYVDVGANIGDSILAINPQKKDSIIGIEPDPKFQKYLKKNLMNLDNVVIERIVCSSSSKKERVRILEKNGTASIVMDDESGEMEKDTLDNIMKRNKLGKIDLLKVDTDGHDFEVLKGARETIKRYKPAIFFECDSFGNKDYVNDIFELFDFLISCGYMSIIMYDNFGYLFGKYKLEDRETLKNFFFYQLNSDFYYFDILVIDEKNSKEFFTLEKNTLTL
jgi:FkbM family methyltransferase